MPQVYDEVVVVTYLCGVQVPLPLEEETSLLDGTCLGRVGIHPEFAALEPG